MLACHIEDAKSPPALQDWTRDVYTFRRLLLQLLDQLGPHDTDVLERTEQAVAALYRLEWSLRRDGQSEVTITAEPKNA